MGLDMFLYKRTFIGARYEHRKVTGKIELWRNGISVPIDVRNIAYIWEDVGVWRKANAIHNWFVKNVQHGEDDCGDHFVQHKQLVELYTLCTFLLEEHRKDPVKGAERAEALLPTTSGCFFGDIDYDEWYWHSIECTIAILEPLVKTESHYDIDYIYGSSW